MNVSRISDKAIVPVFVLTEGSLDVISSGLPTSRLSDKELFIFPLIEGSMDVMVGGLPVARIGDKNILSIPLATGGLDVFAN